MRVIDLAKASDKELKEICPAIYVIKNVSGRHNGMFGYGVVGIRSQNSSLFARLKIHEKDQSDTRNKLGRQLYRHAVSPFQKFWALDLSEWNSKSAGLAEDLLRATFAKHYTLKSDSCFVGVDDEDKLGGILVQVEKELRRYEGLGNHRWQHDVVEAATYKDAALQIEVDPT
jgi:hypothetical protein